MSPLAGLAIGCTYHLPYINGNIVDTILENIVVDEHKKKYIQYFVIKAEMKLQ